jgi:hypothetical protein
MRLQINRQRNKADLAAAPTCSWWTLHPREGFTVVAEAQEPRMRLFTKVYVPFHELDAPMRTRFSRHTDTVERY